MGDQQMIFLSCPETSGCGHGETSRRADLHDNYNTWQCDQEKIERSSGNWLESWNYSFYKHLHERDRLKSQHFKDILSVLET